MMPRLSTGCLKRKRRLSPIHDESSSSQCRNCDPFYSSGNFIPAAGSEDGCIFSAENCQFESGSFASRSSLKLLFDVVSGLDAVKKDLVKSTGFGGILEFPEIRNINRKFSLWAMSGVDELRRVLEIGDGIRLKMSKLDVFTVFGLPCCGKAVLQNGISNRLGKEKVLDVFLGEVFKENRSIKVLVGMIERSYVYPMSKIEQDSFRVAFVVFVVSTLLSPSAKFDYASIDYWPAISDADSICSYDWSEFVIIRLMEAVSKLKQDVCSSIKFPNITGCSLFLQVLYLDSIDLGDLNVPHNSFPRIRHFSSDQIRVMLAADYNYQNYLKSAAVGEATKLRPAGDVSYMWAMHFSCENGIPRTGSLLAIWESCVAMARLLDVPLESAGPLFVAASEFQDLVDSGVGTSGLHAIKYISVLVSIMLSFKGGFSYQFSTGDWPIGDGSFSEVVTQSVSRGLSLMSFPIRMSHKDDGKVSTVGHDKAKIVQTYGVIQNGAASSSSGPHVLHKSAFGSGLPSSINSAMESLEAMDPLLNLNQRLVSVMSKFYSFVRRMRVPAEFDLNESAMEQSASPHPVVPYLCRRVPSPRPPWDLGYCWSCSDVNADEVFSKLESISDADGYIIIHRYPKHIQVSARSFCTQVVGKSEMDMDLFDAFIRIVKQEDEELYKSGGGGRWRHFFESDFMAFITSGCFDPCDRNLVHHFSVCNLAYDLSSCKLLFFPLLFQYRWVCYVWCLESNVIHVFDPRYSVSTPDTSVECHERICYLLKTAMVCCCRKYFVGWQQDWMSADLRMVTWLDRSFTGCNRTGVSCALFIRCFDGEDLTPTPKSLDTNTIAAKLILEVVKLRGNIGNLPCHL